MATILFLILVGYICYKAYGWYAIWYDKRQCRKMEQEEVGYYKEVVRNLEEKIKKGWGKLYKDELSRIEDAHSNYLLILNYLDSLEVKADIIRPARNNTIRNWFFLIHSFWLSNKFRHDIESDDILNDRREVINILEEDAAYVKSPKGGILKFPLCIQHYVEYYK